MSDLIKRLEDAAASNPQRAVSTYIREHFNEIRMAKETLRSSWAQIADAAASDGLRNANGEPPKAETMRMAFVREAESRASQANITQSLNTLLDGGKS